MARVIAEIGVNHDGKVEKALALIDAAKGCGADAVKFQVFSPDLLEPPGERREMLRHLHLTYKELGRIRAHTAGLGLEFIATPFDLVSLNFLLGIGVSTIKIGSGELFYRELIEKAFEADSVIVSTGMASLWDIEDALRGLDPIVLHCTSSYPCPAEAANLSAIHVLKGRYRTVGFSDHTTSTVIPAAALCYGAEVIEKHFTLDVGSPGPDHAMSLSPRRFKEMVGNIREMELAIGHGVKAPQECEHDVMEIVEERMKWRGL